MTGGEERFLVTGALGCIGAWTVRTLVRDGAAVIGFDLGSDPRRLRMIMSPDELARVNLVTGDIADLAALEAVIDANGITNLIHLAALQVPFCRADPPLGARVNVVGTINVFEAVKGRADRMAPVVYTSSMAVFADSDVDPTTGRLTVDAIGHPRNHYGVYKQANEGNARIYWQDDGVASIGLRPTTVYGVGRDQGMTSGPTKAVAAAVLGRPYTVPFGGPTLFQYTEDAARTLIAASRVRMDGAFVYNLPGVVADGPALVAAIEAAVPGSAGLISFAPASLPIPSDIDHDGVESLGPLQIRPFADGIGATVAMFRDLAAQGRLDPTEQGLADGAP